MYTQNNASALREHDFVTSSIRELLASNRVIEKCQPSFITSPLSVAVQAFGKKMLILDLHSLNQYVNKKHFKLGD